MHTYVYDYKQISVLDSNKPSKVPCYVPSNFKCNIIATSLYTVRNEVRSYVCCNICPLHEQPKGDFTNFSCTRLLYVCLMVLVLEESILLVPLVHVLANKST